MRSALSALLLPVIAFTVSGCSERENEFADIKEPYLGQEPPGSTPKAFAPGIVSTENYEYSGTFSADMKEFYFIADGGPYDDQTFLVVEYKDGQWEKSIVSPRVGQPVISPDGQTMYLGRRYKERTEIGWSDVKRLGAPFKDEFIMRLSTSASGTRYFDTYNENDPAFPIRYSRLVDGKYEDPIALSEEINTGIHMNHPFIAPDESYLIWDAEREGGYGDSDLYISFRQDDGSWGKAINLGDKINTDAWEAAASVTPDGEYLFFNRNMDPSNYENVDIFWVDAKVIEDLRPR